MIDIAKAVDSAAEDMLAVNSWIEEQYSDHFSSYFSGLKNIDSRMSSKTHTITDEELEYILIDLPLNLFSVAEKLNAMTLNLEVIRLRNKKTVTDKIKSSKETTQTMKKDVAESEIFEDRVLESAYSCLIDRVQKEVSYARELIMGAKKVWDSRRKADEVNPVSVDIPDENPVPIYR